MKVARYVVVGSLCAVLASTWILWNTHLLLPNLSRIIALVGAIAVLALLTGLVGVSVRMLINSDQGEGVGWIGALFGLIIIATLAVLTDINWMIGPWIRSLLGLSSILPNDNLFVAGGWIAHTAAVLIILLFVSALLSIELIIKAIGTLSLMWSAGSKDAQRDDKDPPVNASLPNRFQ